MWFSIPRFIGLPEISIKKKKTPFISNDSRGNIHTQKTTYYNKLDQTAVEKTNGKYKNAFISENQNIPVQRREIPKTRKNTPQNLYNWSNTKF